MRINGLILAAGMSRRMGSFKPLLQIHGRTMIERSIDCMLEAGVEQVTLVLGFCGREIEQTLAAAGYESSQIKLVYNQDYETTDMLHSVKIGVAGLGPCDAFYLLPGDMPAIRPATLRRLQQTMERGQGDIIFPLLEGYRKHPPLIAAKYIPDICGFASEGGLRELWKKMEGNIACMSVEDYGCAIDVDTPVQYESVCRYMA
jgi:molybdenum cofactor cytidylyltransferase